MCTALGLLMDEAPVDSVLEPLADPTLYELRNTGISERERERERGGGIKIRILRGKRKRRKKGEGNGKEKQRSKKKGNKQ